MAGVYRFLARPQWIGFLVLVIVMIVGCLLLARWQLARSDERAARDALVTQNLDREPVSPDELLAVGRDLPDSDRWRQVAVSGTYDPDHVLLVRQRVKDSRPGFYLITPIRGGDGVALWVNRGWIPAAATAEAEPEVPPVPEGIVTVVVRMRQSQPPKNAATDLPPRQVDRIDVPLISKTLDGPVYGGYGDLVSEFPEQAQAPEPLAPPETGGGPHLSYAVQWITFAVIAGVGWYVLIRKERDRILEERAAREASAGRGPDPDPEPTTGENDHAGEPAAVEGNS